jgi:hypothetical protein
MDRTRVRRLHVVVSGGERAWMALHLSERRTERRASHNRVARFVVKRHCCRAHTIGGPGQLDRPFS